MLILIAESIFKAEQIIKIFSIKFSRFSHRLHDSVLEIFSFFFGTLQIRWRQLSWASIVVRENYFLKFFVLNLKENLIRADLLRT
jgi:hypothetical protein